MLFRKSKLNNSAGFSLAEIMIVLVIIGTLLGFILPRVREGSIKSKIGTTKMKMSEIENKINEYNSECGKNPKSLSFVYEDDPSCRNWTSNSKGKKQTADEFGTDFVYEATDTGYTLKSLGADKKEGGSGFDKDIYSENSQGAGE
ncbi:MAG: type II secretion system protein GspG [Bdellovibrio sp.]|nr:type II secretion system protein GspG [Bdellovibrio sp.]